MVNFRRTQLNCDFFTLNFFTLTYTVTTVKKMGTGYIFLPKLNLEF